jgi:hypothetical protein
MTPHAIFVDIDAEAGAVEALHMAARRYDWLRGDIFAERGVRQRQPPVDVGNDRRRMQRRGVGRRWRGSFSRQCPRVILSL